MNKIGNATLYHLDCLTLQLDEQPDAIVSDPPYGIDWNTDYTRFTKGACDTHKKYKKIEGDTQSFDPTPWLKHKNVILFGYQFFSQKLPVGSVLVWLKKRDNKLGAFCSDCELAWCNHGAGCYMFKHIWDGFDRESDRNQSAFHPTQKPVAVMDWCISFLELPKGSLIYDPYMGSGSTGIAAVNAGYRFIGCEIDVDYYKIAVNRHNQNNDMFDEII